MNTFPVELGMFASGHMSVCQEESAVTHSLVASMHPGVWASQVAQIVKNLPVMQETWVHSLGREDPREKGMDALSNMHQVSSKRYHGTPR